MTPKLQTTIKDEVTQLPKEMQEAISTTDWVKIAEIIGEKYLLDEDGVTNLQLETLLVLVGMTDPEFYAVNVENEVETTKESATKIAGEVFEKIFVLISNALEENIKKNLKDRKPNAVQTLNFILSGGDYTAFIDKRDVPSEADNKVMETKISTPSLADIKANTQNTNTPTSTRQMTDLKSKLVI